LEISIPQAGYMKYGCISRDLILGKSMTIGYFLHVDGPTDHLDGFQSWADEVYGPALHAISSDCRIEIYSPENVSDPYLGTEAGKLLIVQVNFPSRHELESTISVPDIAAALKATPSGPDICISSEALIILPCPLADGSKPARTAPLSFVVRYYRPIEHEQTFIEYYIDNHPPIQVNFPKIRNIFCYLAIDWQDSSGVAASESFLGNEIVFDSTDDLNDALQSDARHELREDYKNFLPHEGTVTHHAMLRRILYPGRESE